MRRGVEEGETIRPQHPFVGWEGHEVRLPARHVHRHGAHHLRRVHHQGRPQPAHRRAELVEVHERAVRPMQRAQRGQCQRAGAGAMDGGKQGGGPVAIGRARHLFHHQALLGRQPVPHQAVGRELACHPQHPATRREAQVAGGSGHAVADRAHDGDVVRRGADQRGGGGPRPLGQGLRRIACLEPRLRLGPHAPRGRLPHRQRQRRPGGGIEVAHRLGQLEQGALAGERRGGVHRRGSSGRKGWCQGHSRHARPCATRRRMTTHLIPA